VCPFVMLNLSFQMHVSDRATHLISKSISFHLGEVQPYICMKALTIVVIAYWIDYRHRDTRHVAYQRVPRMHGEPGSTASTSGSISNGPYVYDLL
jgi:hypothetical protein